MTVRFFPLQTIALLGGSALLLCSCGAASQNKKNTAKGSPEVGFVVVQPTSVPIVTELAGRTAAYQSSEVRPQVSGLILHRFFTEGALVRQGQPLYQIDPSLYRASANQAQANLASAAANAEATKAKADRYKPLVEMEAVAKQDYTDATAVARQAAAAVQQNRAALDTAKINLRFTTVPAPITGRIGRSLFTEGALVTASQTSPLTTIQRLDPIYVDIQQASADLLRLRRALASGGAIPTRADVQLKLEDGSNYGPTGDVEFSEVVVDPATGTVTLRARFPNPQGLLLPGMFVRASFAQSIDTKAFLVPQQAVSRDPKGNATVFVVGPGNKAIQKTVVAPRTQGTFWVVTDGLNAGDKVITQGVGKVKPNQPIKPVNADTPQTIKAPTSDKSKG
ncbi:membrane fusion protein (multidrug efflux system) [Sphingomonas sp. BE270]|jgi:membrane fusion protein (multidrug efflux system)|uniref:efflux RND transporter periplasmic adaptor subunit n=1 Tax=unclassified Sphingomonas TaxID=196159 RepID=UPI00068A4CAF|nr:MULTISPECIES: efflux RND transporter periplasmic adaptor subunit [unclassified Sphingomonas]MDR6849738.1 membrane fusion protein (multidrug efflux system) [Sphingomonas sp. BE137]MDR7257240.1 membrane fusion protein (multidrug efflux system) [Sphingomonas sp. BE270]